MQGKEDAMTEISPEPQTRKPTREEIKHTDCFVCELPIGNKAFEIQGNDVICVECRYEIGHTDC
jgi:hypothetical protein